MVFAASLHCNFGGSRWEDRRYNLNKKNDIYKKKAKYSLKKLDF